MAAAALLGPLSRLQPTWDNGLVWLLTGTILCAALTPFVLRSTWSKVDTILAVWAVMVFVRSLGLGIEGSLFKPTQTSAAIIGAFFGILIGLLVAWLSVTLFLPASTTQSADKPRTWWAWTWRVLLVGLAYFVFYFVFGATNAVLYTRSFYENNPRYGLSLPPTATIFLAQLIRGPLFGLGSLFIVRSANRHAVRQPSGWDSCCLSWVAWLPMLKTLSALCRLASILPP